MENPTQRLARIVTALEDLAAQEAAALANHDFTALSVVQERTQPLVEFITTHGELAGSLRDLRGRIVAVHELRGRTSETLRREMERTRLELAQTEVQQRRVARIMPAYGQPVVASRHFQAVG